MGKLNIAHHKSYHPYRRDNIERVRRDEEEARLKEAQEEGRMQLADAEARIEHLREKASISLSSTRKMRIRDETKELDRQLKTGVSSTMTAAIAQLPTTNGHINFFEDLEHSSIAAAVKASKTAVPPATEMGVPLAPSAKDMKPWYSEESHSDLPDAKKKRDERRKSAHDPLTSITKQLAASHTPSSSSSRQLQTSTTDQTQARLSRESSERQRALALIEKRKREMAGNQTPSTVHGGGDTDYSDQFNRSAVLAAHQDRDRRWDEHAPPRHRHLQPRPGHRRELPW